MNTFTLMQRLARRLVQSVVLGGMMLLTSSPYCQELVAQSLNPLPVPEIADDMVFEHITAKQGLPQNSVNAITQDKYGFIWFATQDGLCRYDGYSMKVFRPQAGIPQALQAGFLYRLLIDSRGNLWAATVGGGLSRYDYKAGNFVTLRSDVHNPKTLPGDYIKFVHKNNLVNLGKVQEK